MYQNTISGTSGHQRSMPIVRNQLAMYDFLLVVSNVHSLTVLLANVLHIILTTVLMQKCVNTADPAISCDISSTLYLLTDLSERHANY